MRYRELGRTGMLVSEIGFGTLGIGNTPRIGAEKRASVQALIAAYDAGINFFDTTWADGRGECERVLARVFGRTPNIYIASTAPPCGGTWPPIQGTPMREVFPPAQVLRFLHKTLSNLRRDAIDLYQFYLCDDEWVRDLEWLVLIDRLMRSGQVRAIGISITHHQAESALAVLATGMIDTVQVVYNLFDQFPEDRLFPYCIEHRIGVIACVPLDEGGLTGKIRPGIIFPRRDIRNRYFEEDRQREVWERVQSIAADAGIPIEQMPNLALRFCLSHPAVSTVIPGMRRTAHVQMNSLASNDGSLPAAVLHKLRSHKWVRSHQPSLEGET